MPIHEIIQLKETGGDLILKKFENISKQREKFTQPAMGQVKSPQDIDTGEKKAKSIDDIIKKEDQAINKFKKLNDLKNKFFKPSYIKKEEYILKGTETLREKKKQEESETEEQKFNRTSREKLSKEFENIEREKYNRIKSVAMGAANGLNNLANSASSLDPTQFATGVVDSLKNVTQKFTSAIPVLGNVLSGMADYAGEMTKIGATMASNSLNAIKYAQNSAIDTLEKRGRLQYLGGSNVIGPQYSLQEQAGIVEQIANRFGRFQGTKLANTVKELFKGAPDVQQATELAAGNFKALGTDKGFFLQQISDSLGNLPPSISQEIQNQLLQQFVTPEGKKELNKDYAIKNREMRSALMTQDQNTQITIAGMGKNAEALNNTLNQLSLNLTRNGSNLTGALDTMAKTINAVVARVSGENKARS